MKIDIIESDFTSNVYIVHVENSVYIIDPSADVNIINTYISKEEVVKGIILTHCHIDHIYFLEEVRNYYNCKVYASFNANLIASDCEHNFSFYMGLDKSIDLKDYIKLNDKDVIDNLFEVIYTPGHTIDSICIKIEDKLFTGDTLFDRSVGRSDLYSGDNDTLMQSLEKLLKLDDLTIYPGHGNISTLKIQIMGALPTIAAAKKQCTTALDMPFSGQRYCTLSFRLTFPAEQLYRMPALPIWQTT